MPSEIREFLVFIASPSDCEPERAEVRNAIEQLNSSLQHLPISFRVTGWETTTPALGRAQGLINPMVDECDVFIGVLANRWGSPSGEESSGFIEEFSRARDRRLAHGALPHMALHFRRPSVEMLRDPGRELSQVLDFKNELRDEFVALYGEHTDANDFGKQVLAGLTNFALRNITQTDPVSGSGQSEENRTGSSLPPAGSRVDEARAELAQTAQLMADAFAGVAERWFDRDRVSLIARAFAIDDDELLPEHLVNRLYQRRAELTLSIGECRLLLRTLLHDVGASGPRASRNAPGWAFLRQGRARGLAAADANDLVDLVGESARVARGAFLVLELENARPSLLWPRAGTRSAPPRFRDRWKSALESAGVNAVGRYTVSVLRPSDQSFLAELAGSDGLEKYAEFLEAISSYSAGLPLQLVRYGLRSAAGGAEWIVPVIVAAVPDLTAAELTEAITKSALPAGLRKAALSELADRGGVTQELFDRLLKNDNGLWDTLLEIALQDGDVASLLSDVLTRETNKPSREALDRIKLALFDNDATFADLKVEDLDYPKKWKGVARNHPELALDEARSVLSSKAEEYEDQLRELETFRNYPVLVRHLAAELRAEALEVLAASGDSSDADFVLPFLVAGTDFALHRSAVKAMVRIANFEADREVEALKGVEDYFLPTDEIEARLSAAEINFARAVLQLDHPMLKGRAVGVMGQGRILSKDDLVDLLHDPDMHVRAGAVRGLVSSLSRPDLIEVLDTYPKTKDWYWYNVVALLDEALFGPPSIRERARSASVG